MGNIQNKVDPPVKMTTANERIFHFIVNDQLNELNLAIACSYSSI